MKVVANQCPKCLTVINKKGRLIRHSRLCKGKKSAPTTPTPPEGRTEKKLSITNIDEAVVDNVRDAASLEEQEFKHGPPWKCDNKFRWRCAARLQWRCDNRLR